MPEEELLPTELRAHIKAEQLYPDALLFLRSTSSILIYAIIPFLFIAAVVVISGLDIFTTPVLIGLSLPLLLAAQRCFQTLVHDLSHRLYSFDLNRNDTLGNYLAAGWTGVSVPAYRRIHLQHHKHNGSRLDPEHISFAMIKDNGGLLRHCLRYIAGLEALRLIRKYYGSNKTEAQKAMQSKHLSSSNTHIVVCQLILAVTFIFIAEAWYLYGIWLYMAISWNPLLSNLRFLVEHPGETDLTVSTAGNWLERLYFAPYNFNYHLEHHLWPNLPPYHLAATHNYLEKQGYFERHPEFLGKGFISSLWGRH